MPDVPEPAAVSFSAVERMLSKWSGLRSPDYPLIVRYAHDDWEVTYNSGATWRYVARREVPARDLTDRFQSVMASETYGADLPDWDEADYGPGNPYDDEHYEYDELDSFDETADTPSESPERTAYQIDDPDAPDQMAEQLSESLEMLEAHGVDMSKVTLESRTEERDGVRTAVVRFVHEDYDDIRDSFRFSDNEGAEEVLRSPRCAANGKAALAAMKAIDTAREMLTAMPDIWELAAGNSDSSEAVETVTETLHEALDAIHVECVKTPVWDALLCLPEHGSWHAGYGCDPAEVLTPHAEARLAEAERAAALLAVAAGARVCVAAYKRKGGSAGKRKSKPPSKAAVRQPRDDGDALDMLAAASRIKEAHPHVCHAADEAIEAIRAAASGIRGKAVGVAARSVVDAAMEELNDLECASRFGPFAPLWLGDIWHCHNDTSWHLENGDHLPALLAVCDHSDDLDPEFAPDVAVLVMRPPLEGELLDRWQDENLAEDWADLCADRGFSSALVPLGDSYSTCSNCMCPLPDRTETVECPNCGSEIATLETAQKTKDAHASVIYFDTEQELADAAIRLESVFLEWRSRIHTG